MARTVGASCLGSPLSLALKREGNGPNLALRRGLVSTGTARTWPKLQLRDHKSMNGIHFVTDEKGRKVAVQIDLKKHGAALQDLWDGLVSESRRSAKRIPCEQYRAKRLKRN